MKHQLSQSEKCTWARSLHVGKQICDCRFKHLNIESIEHIYGVSVRWKLWLSYLPNPIADFIESLLVRVGVKEWYDAELVLEDGQHCSAMNCCDPVDHSLADHPN